MRKEYHVEARWDPDAKVWTSVSDVPGLVIETATLAEFEALLHQLVPEVLADNGQDTAARVEWNAKGGFEVELA